MFEDCSVLTELNLGGWNVSNVRSMYYMFRGCVSLTELNISNWSLNEEVLYDYYGMFSNCAAASACKVIATQATKEFLLARTGTTSMNPDWFIWEDSSYNEM